MTGNSAVTWGGGIMIMIMIIVHFDFFSLCLSVLFALFFLVLFIISCVHVHMPHLIHHIHFMLLQYCSKICFCYLFETFLSHRNSCFSRSSSKTVKFLGGCTNLLCSQKRGKCFLALKEIRGAFFNASGFWGAKWRDCGNNLQLQPYNSLKVSCPHLGQNIQTYLQQHLWWKATTRA